MTSRPRLSREPWLNTYALMAMESVPAAEAGPSVAEVLADFALMAMESLPVVEAGPSVTEAVADSAQRALGDLPVGEVSTFGAPRPRLLPPGAGFMSREEFSKRLREAGHEKETQSVQTGQAQHVYHIIVSSSEQPSRPDCLFLSTFYTDMSHAACHRWGTGPRRQLPLCVGRQLQHVHLEQVRQLQLLHGGPQ